MDKVNQKMRKFNLRGVLIGLRATALGNAQHKVDSSSIEETLRSEYFQVGKVGKPVYLLLIRRVYYGEYFACFRTLPVRSRKQEDTLGLQSSAYTRAHVHRYTGGHACK